MNDPFSIFLEMETEDATYFCHGHAGESGDGLGGGHLRHLGLQNEGELYKYFNQNKDFLRA